MKEYVVIKYIDESLVFDYKAIKKDERDYVNTNNFYNDTLFYTLRYFKKNKKTIIKKFNTHNINWMVVVRILTFNYVSFIMSELKISNLRLLFNSTLSIKDYDELLNVNTLKNIDCYYMPSFIVRKYNDSGVRVSTNNKNTLTSKFMLSEDAFDYDTLYYKKQISIREIYPNLMLDIEEFLKINYNLKAINLYVYSKDIIKKIVELVKNDEAKNVLILLHQSNDKGEFIKQNFLWLKQLNKECKEELICEFRIIYEDSYMKRNLFKQLSFNNLKLLFIMLIYLSAIMLLIYKSYEYVEKLSAEKLKTELMEMSNEPPREELTGIEIGEDYVEPEPAVKGKYELNNIMSELTRINSDTVGYLVVNNTQISYPVVRSSDNNYYLKNDFYKKKTSAGWIFLDYRNSRDKLDMNNIIYGHRMNNGTMFGSLKNTLSSTWRNDSKNMTISYDTLYGSYKFKIFSIYKVDYTTDYLRVDFSGEKDFDSFVNMIRKRSVFKSNESVKYGDILLTLSTCSGSRNQRLVVHAVMQKVGE